MAKDNSKTANALHSVVQLLEQLDESARSRIIKSVLTYFHTDSDAVLRQSPSSRGLQTTPRSPSPDFSDDSKPSPKEFLLQKQPKTDVERMACLAYYLTHFRDTPFFKTLDLAKLNTEAAQPKFSNATYTAHNAANAGYLVPAPKAQRQISGAGEQFVIALPDRDAARQAIASARRRKASRKKK